MTIERMLIGSVKNGMYSANSVAITTGGSGSSGLYVYAWSNSGFGARYSNPVTMSGLIYSVAFSADSSVIFIGTNTGVQAWSWSGYGFGTQYSSPATPASGSCRTISIHPSNNAIVLSSNSVANTSAYQWTSASGFGTKYSNPTTTLLTNVVGVRFSTGGGAAMFSSTASPYVQAYDWSYSTGFGSAKSDPSTPVPGRINSPVTFNQSGTAVAMGHVLGGTPQVAVSAYAWNDSSGFGSKYANPSTIVDCNSYCAQYSPTGNAIIVGGVPALESIYAYAWSSAGFGVKYSNPTSALSFIPMSIAFSKNGLSIAACGQTSPYIGAYAWSDAGGFGAKYSQPTVLPNYGYIVAFS